MLPGRSARDFIQWVEHNPVSLCTSLGLAVVPNDIETALQPGFTLAYEPGQCGFHRRWGHIEIVTSVMSKRCVEVFPKIGPNKPAASVPARGNMAIINASKIKLFSTLLFSSI